MGWLHVLLAVWRELHKADPPPTTRAWSEPLERKPPLTGVEEMGAYRCSTCSLNYPSNGSCRACGAVLAWIYNAEPTPDGELPPEIKKVLPALSDKEAAELAADWAYFKVEAERRGAGWTIADVFEEGVPRPREDAA